MSLVVCETRDSSQTPGDKKVAYLVDATTARVDCLVSGVASLRGVSERSDAHPNSTNSQSSLTVPHAHKIDWLELNARGTHLLFRDKKRRLFLVDLSRSQKTCLLEHVSYTQWVPGADVVVAQSGKMLCVWYVLGLSQIPPTGCAYSYQKGLLPLP